MVAVPLRIIDPSKDLNSNGLRDTDWKERFEGWKIHQDKNINELTNDHPEGKGDREGTSINGEHLPM